MPDAQFTVPYPEHTHFVGREDDLARLEAAVRRSRSELSEPQAQDELVAHAFARLRERSQCLLILDNVADPAALDESLTADCVPARLPGRMMFTTRRRDLGQNAMRLETGKNEWTLPGHKSWVSAVAVTPDGWRAVSSGADGTLRLWDLVAGRELACAVLVHSARCVAITLGQPLPTVAGDAAGGVYCLEWVE